MLGRGLVGQGDKNALHLLPLLHDQARVDFPNWLEQDSPVLGRMLETIEGLLDFRLDIPVARRELIAKHMEEGKIDLVGAVRVRRMDVWVDVRSIVEQEVKRSGLKTTL